MSGFLGLRVECAFASMTEVVLVAVYTVVCVCWQSPSHDSHVIVAIHLVKVRVG